MENGPRRTVRVAGPVFARDACAPWATLLGMERVGVEVVGEGVADNVRDCCLLGSGVGVEAGVEVLG